jgi:hypothetical protein
MVRNAPDKFADFNSYDILAQAFTNAEPYFAVLHCF